jgi:polysaccharide export outer membrane protein
MPSSSKARFIVAIAAAQLLAGCGGKVGQFVWADAYRPQPAAAKGYRIALGDLLSVRVWNQESVSGRARVRPDGMISLPLVNDVEAAGVEPSALAARIQGKLKDFIVNPNVSVSVEEQAPFEISILGEVARPGVYRIEHDASVLKALALAGGITQIAARDRIFVLRYGESEDPKVPTRVRFTYEALTRAEGAAAKFGLRNGDVVVVE